MSKGMICRDAILIVTICDTGKAILICGALLILTGCGGDGDRGTSATYSIGGTVSGLVGTGMVLRNNGGDNLSVSSNGAFSFATALASGATYNVTVLTQPANPTQNCTVSNGMGTVNRGVSGVSISCTTVYTVGGTVAGLAGFGLVLRDNGGDNLTVSSNGAFSFAAALAGGATYDVTVLTQPSNPTQTCAVSNGMGTVSGSVAGVSITCITYHGVSVTVSGLAGSGLVLRDNGADNLAVSTNGSFSFATALADGASYNVTVLTQPINPNQTCTVANGTGTVGVNVTAVAVTCVSTYRIGGTVSGLVGSGLLLRNNGADDLTISTNGAFSFATPLASGVAYNVMVSTQPTVPAQNCVLSNGSANGTVTNADVTTVAIVCRTIGRFAYAENRLSNNVSGYSIDPASGALTPIANSPFVSGTHPVSVTVDANGRFAYIANFGSNDVSVYSIDATTGALTPIANSPFAAGSSPQCTAVNPNGNLLFVGNSSSGNISAYTIDPATGALTPVAGSPFSSPQMLDPTSVVVDPSGRFVYVADGAFTDVFAYAIDPITGALAAVAGSPSFAALGPSSITVAPDDGFAYVANIAADSVSAFMVDALSGALTPAANSPFAVGTRPDSIAISPDGQFAYVSRDTSANISVFTLDSNTGAVTAVAGGTFSTGASPGSVTIDPSGKFVYVSSSSSNNVYGYRIDAVSGVLTPVKGAPFSAGTNPGGVAVSK
jgi:6-phosphogluconolactonase (cycloisomerase 2 family)